MEVRAALWALAPPLGSCVTHLVPQLPRLHAGAVMPHSWERGDMEMLLTMSFKIATLRSMGLTGCVTLGRFSNPFVSLFSHL